MAEHLEPLEKDQQFFSALLAASVEALDRLLADDFLLIDVMGGSEIAKGALLEVIASGQLKFDAIEPADRRVRMYQTTAVITGRTRMHGRFGAEPFTASSRYTHVYVEQQGQWRLVAAQGTQVSPEPEPSVS
ncbi:MAG: nuclear transport factor 2 family protein [Deltaproteobacteria bacterium]|nr:nuclear transport factor 2 family protein [Deltaproteobacteria bacterium]